MGKYFDMLMEDVRMKEGLTACMNCGICTGVCPAAEFYDYDPRQIVNTVQTKDDDAIEQLLKSETIWYCGECMSCRPRCPRANTPGYIIQALRAGMVPGEDIGPAPSILVISRLLGTRIAMDKIEEAAYEELASVGFTKEWMTEQTEPMTPEEIISRADEILPGGEEYQVLDVKDAVEISYAEV